MTKKFLTYCLAALLCGQAADAFARQTTPARATQRQTGAQPAKPQTPKPQTAPPQRPVPPPAGGPALTDYGIQIAPDMRLISMMAALDAAGWDPTPKGEKPSVFRELVRKDLAGLDPVLRSRMQDFYRRNALKDESATPAEQAARYVTLAYALGPPPDFEAPPRSDDLPPGVLDVLDFVPLLREFYRQPGFGERLTAYVSMHRAAGDDLRRPASEVARSVLSYLNTRPLMTVVERVQASEQAAQGDKKKKDEKRAPLLREKERRFVIVPDLLAAPGALNFRVVRDDYFAVVTVPVAAGHRWSELRRAYIQYVIDPLVIRFNRDIAAKRAEVRQLLDKERGRTGRDITPDVFLAVSRSLVAAADVRMEEAARLQALREETGERLRGTSNQAERDAALKESKERQAAVEDSSVAQLAEAYERGAVLSFYFAEQLRGLEGSGFDIANFIPDMIASINPERELRRPAEYAEAVARFRESRRRALEARAGGPPPEAPPDARRAALIKSLADVDDLLRVRNYEEAETRLLALRDEYREEPRVYFALGQAASVAAQGAFDEALQEQRLNAALAHFRQALLLASPDTDRSIILRAHFASGRILAHFDRRDEAIKEFDAVLAMLNANDRLYQEALAEKKKLTEQK